MFPVDGIEGALVIVGGGGIPDTARQAYIELAGGAEKARIVVIPTASARADRDDAETYFAEPWRGHGVANVSVLHTRDRDEANDEAFIEPLRTATGVWFSGGTQSRLIDTYLGTRVHDELRAVLSRGGVIGGTSAGAAVMSDPMIARGSAVPELAAGFGFLPGVIVDQHAEERGRLPRLHRALEGAPGYFGMAINEGTALIVQGRRARVVGRSNVTVLQPPGAGRGASELRLRERASVDLVALSRAAVARAGVAFPPQLRPAVHVPNGTLFLGGGGGLPREAVRRFVEAAGGGDARIVVVASALGAWDDPDAGRGDAARFRHANVQHIAVFNPRTPADTESQELLEALRQATGIWFSGGRQWRLVDAFEGTEALALMREVLARGGAIGGSSAGASIQPEYMVRGHPLDNSVMMAEGYERGFGFLPGAAVDQHFSERGRHGDLASLVRTYPQVLGIGIDEGTFAIMQDSVLEVVGRGQVFIYDALCGDHDETDDDIASTRPQPIALRAGERIDLTDLRVVN